MDRELEDQMFDRFERFFPKGRDVNVEYSLMYFGFSHGNGWYSLIYNLFAEIEKIAGDKYKIEVLQVKQKFGALRVYISVPDKKMNKLVTRLILDAEKLSMRTCEGCGKDGNSVRTNRGLILTLCEKCGNDYGK